MMPLEPIDPFLKYANRLFEIISGNVNCISNLGFYLFEEPFNRDIELRNRLGTIWVCSLFDTIKAQEKDLSEIGKEATSRGWASLIQALNELEKFVPIVIDLLEPLSCDEQLFLHDFRNQIVHSYLSKRHSDHVKIMVLTSGAMVKKTMSWHEYHETIRRFYNNGLSLDETLNNILTKIFIKLPEHPYWRIIGFLQHEKTAIYEKIRMGESVYFPYDLLSH
jgi:hypothetical protein